MDSGYILTYEMQASMVSKIAEIYPKYYKFANYHNPLYPSCTDSTPNSNDMLVLAEGIKYWTPVFDKYNLVASF